MEGRLQLKTKQISELRRLADLAREKLRLGNTRKLALAVMGKTKKSQQSIYAGASVPMAELDLSETEVEELESRSLIKFLSKRDRRLTITLKTMLMLDYGITNPSNNIDEMLNDFNQEFFERVMELSEEPLQLREKAIIIGILGLGALTDQYALRLNEENQDHFRACVDCAAEFLKSLGSEFDDGSLEELWSENVVGESPVLARMRRLDKIQAHTEGIYKKNGKHFLDLMSEDQVNENKLSYLLGRLFDKRRLTFEEKKGLTRTLDKMQEYGYKLFKSSPPFDMLEVRRQVKRIIESNI